MEELIRTPFVREVAAVCVDPSPTRPPLPPWLKSVPTLVVLGESSPRIGPGPVNNWLFERRLGGTGGAAAPPPRNSVVMDDRRIPAPSYSVDAVSRPGMSAPAPTSPATSGRVGPVSRGDVSVASNGRLPAAISASTEGDKSAAPPVLAGSTDDSAVQPYFGLEMSGKSWSDIYSFLVERAATDSDAGSMITRNFELLKSLIGGGAGSGPVGGGGGGGSAHATTEKEAALLREFEAYAASRDRDVKGPVMRK
jgi:hypothetical protein